MSGNELAHAAESFVGASFRLHGRDPIMGLDCVGLVLLAMAEIGRPIRLPVSYALRNLEPERFMQLPAAAGFFEPDDVELDDGDVLVFAPGAAQLHLAIVAIGGGIIHAHAGLRRVVRTPFPLPWPIIGHWRLA
jgi:cell wall-associated NlpC family hydrolase